MATGRVLPAACCQSTWGTGPVLAHELNIIPLSADLIANNARILRTSPTDPLRGTRRQLSGTVHNGYTSVTASIAPGSGGRIDLHFEIEIPSVTDPAFARLRNALTGILQPKPTEATVALEAGIIDGTVPPPASRMSAYASYLFADLFYSGVVDTNNSRDFDGMDTPQPLVPKAMFAVRGTHVSRLQICGALHVEADVDGAEAKVYIPTTAIAFDDGITIPFAGYAREVLLGGRQTKLLSVPMPASLWVTPTE